MRHRFLVIILSGFISGVFISSFVNFGPTLALLFVFLGVIFGITYFLNRSKVFGAVALLFIAVGLGQLRYGQDDLTGWQSDPQNKIGQRVSLIGVVSDEPEQKKITPDWFWKQKTKAKFLIYVQNYPQYKYGDKLKIAGVLKNRKILTTKCYPISAIAEITHHFQTTIIIFLGKYIWSKTIFITRYFIRKRNLFPAATACG